MPEEIGTRAEDAVASGDVSLAQRSAYLPTCLTLIIVLFLYSRHITFFPKFE